MRWTLFFLLAYCSIDPRGCGRNPRHTDFFPLLPINSIKTSTPLNTGLTNSSLDRKLSHEGHALDVIIVESNTLVNLYHEYISTRDRDAEFLYILCSGDYARADHFLSMHRPKFKGDAFRVGEVPNGPANTNLGSAVDGENS